MGHVRLGSLPRTRRWNEVVGLVAGGADSVQVATATINAAQKALGTAVQDKGLIETIWLLTQLPLAARSDDFADALRRCNVHVSSSPSLIEITAAVSEAIDAKLPGNHGRTDLGEIAQMAATETISSVIGERAQGLFGTVPADVHREFARLATAKQFGIFARDFFARFTHKCLDYFVSRTLSHHLGEGRRFTTLAEQSQFSQALKTHCREAAKIVESFAGEWFSKTNWERQGEISKSDIAAFTSYAMTKLVSELKQGAGSNG